MEFGKVETVTGANECSLDGDEFNPLQEVDEFGRKNPFQDPNRGTMPTFTTLPRGSSNTFPTCKARGFTIGTGLPDSGYEDLEPFTLLQNLDGLESIMGRAVVIYLQQDGSVKTCCIIAREEAPDKMALDPYPCLSH